MCDAKMQHFCYPKMCFWGQTYILGILQANYMGVVILIKPKNTFHIWVAFDNKVTCATTSLHRNLPILIWELLFIVFLPSWLLPWTHIYLFLGPSFPLFIFQVSFNSNSMNYVSCSLCSHKPMLFSKFHDKVYFPWARWDLLQFNLVRVEIRELRPEVIAESDKVLVHYRSRTNVWWGSPSKTLA